VFATTKIEVVAVHVVFCVVCIHKSLHAAFCITLWRVLVFPVCAFHFDLVALLVLAALFSCIRW